MSEFVAIASDELTARINPLGAELWSLTDRLGREYMTDADPAFWAGHAPLLFPIVGRLSGDTLRIDGREYAMKQHGFARRSEWELVGAGSDAATFRLTDSAETRASYPFAFEIAILFALEDSTLSMVVRVGNPGPGPLPFSFGFHPAFAWPLPGATAKEAHRVVFSDPEPHDIARLNADGLLEHHEPSPVIGRELALRRELFEDDAMIWDRLASASLAYGVPGGPELSIAFQNTPMLGLWQKPGARYICIEPWAGLADPEGFSGDFRTKPGVIELLPGEGRRFRMDVTVHQAPVAR